MKKLQSARLFFEFFQRQMLVIFGLIDLWFGIKHRD